MSASEATVNTITGRVYVVGDNIDTDQIIPAEYLNLVPTIPEEYAKLGSYALVGRPLPPGEPPFIPPNEMTTPYTILVAGRNFGCGSSREHAPIALGAAGAEAVVAESFARIFFRNCVATGELYPVETPDRLVDAFRSGDEAVLDLDASTITNRRTGRTHTLRPLGDAAPVIAAGGLFAYARQTGMIPGDDTRVKHATIAVFGGDGIGPEVTAEAVAVLETVAPRHGLALAFSPGTIGGAAIDASGTPLPAAELERARAADAVLLGAVGGPKWDDPGSRVRPEQALLGLRHGLGLYANLRPVRALPELFAAAPLRPEVLRGVDLVVVRELTGGIYFGKPSERRQGAAGREAVDTLFYTEDEVARLLHAAFALARQRRRLLASVDKANILASSRLWREVAHEVARDYPDVRHEDVLVDAMAMHLIRRPADFDVIATENMFGDILTDEAAMLAGSMGMLPSASLAGAPAADRPCRGLYEPIHGSAPDIAGKDRANPLAAILSAAMLCRYSLGATAAAVAIEAAVAAVLAAGLRTADLAAAGEPTVGCVAMGRAVRERLEG